MTVILTEHPPKQSFASDGLLYNNNYGNYSRLRILEISSHSLVLTSQQYIRDGIIVDVVDTSSIVSCKDYRDRGDSIKLKIKDNLTALKEQQAEIRSQTEQIRLLIKN